MPTLDRITSAVPWPRGIAWYEGRLIALARGAHRNQGGPQKEDQGGTLFEVSSDTYDLVDPSDTDVSNAVLVNAKIFAEPTDPPFKLWDPSTQPPHLDTRTDRPYATLHWDSKSQSFYICAFAGIDLPKGVTGQGFWPNASCSVHRFDIREADPYRMTNGKWFGVEAHRFDNVPEFEIRRLKAPPYGTTFQVPDRYYPHETPYPSYPPRGLLNGPDGLFAVGDYLYVVGLDNNKLAQYDISSNVEFPEGRIVPVPEIGNSAVAAFGSYLYLANRKSGAGGARIVRYPIDPTTGQILDDHGDEYFGGNQTVTAELIATVDDLSAGGRIAHIIDIDFDSEGRLFVSMANGSGKVWCIDDPSPSDVFRASDYFPYIDLQLLSPNSKAKCADICFDDEDNLYVCSGNKDTQRVSHYGTIYRVRG